MYSFKLLIDMLSCSDMQNVEHYQYAEIVGNYFLLAVAAPEPADSAPAASAPPGACG